ncbi:lmo0937 family membrane protein [Clostridium sp.]|mgnify:FL=1|nr:lmo0937 family membrane protein [uncultured Clostridium sp.]
MGLLRWIGGVIVFFWLVGFLLHIGGGLIHMLLVLAVILFLVDMIFGKR